MIFNNNIIVFQILQLIVLQKSIILTQNLFFLIKFYIMNYTFLKIKKIEKMQSKNLWIKIYLIIVLI